MLDFTRVLALGALALGTCVVTWEDLACVGVVVLWVELAAVAAGETRKTWILLSACSPKLRTSKLSRETRVSHHLHTQTHTCKMCSNPPHACLVVFI